MKKYFIIAVFLFLGITTYSQDKYKITERTKISKSAIDSLEEAVTTKIRKDKQLRNIEGLKQLHIFNLPFRYDISKEEYLNKAFLNKLLPEYIIYNQGGKIIKGCLMSSKKNIKSCLETKFIIYDSIGKAKALGEYFSLYKYENDYKNYELVQLFLNNEFDFVFQLNFLGDYIGVKDSNIFVLREDKSKGYVKDYDWEGYMNALYDKEIRFYEELKQDSLKYLYHTLRFKYLSEIESLENRITRLVRKNKYIPNIMGLKQFHIFYFSPDTLLGRKDFEDNLFVYKFYPNYYNVTTKSFFKNKENKYFQTRTFVYEDMNNEQIAEGNALGIARVTKTSNLLKYFIKEKVEMVFNIGVKNVYICVKDSDVFVIKDINDEIRKYSVKEFKECCFNELCPTCK